MWPLGDYYQHLFYCETEDLDVDLLKLKVIQNTEIQVSPKSELLESLSVRMLVLSEIQRKKEETHFLVFKYFPCLLRLSDILGHSLLTCRSNDHHQNWISGISFYLLFPFFKFYRVKRTQQTFHRRSPVEDKQYERKEP